MSQENTPVSVIVFPMSSWWEWMDGRRNRNYFLFEQMRRDTGIQKIIVIEPPALTWKRAIKNLLAWKRYSSRYRCIKKGLLFSVWQIDDTVVLISLVWKIPVNSIHYARIIPHIVRDWNIRVVWSWNPFIDVARIKHIWQSAVFIFDAVDDWAVHPVYARVKQALGKRYTEIARMYDIIFTVSQELKERYFNHHPRTYHVSNGVDIQSFDQARTRVQKALIAQVVYVGVIQERFDVALVAECARALPDVRFVIAGPVWKGVDVSVLGVYSNVILKGPVQYTQVPELLAQSWVGIIPHTIDSFTQSMDPMKAYEYLAAGIPVVSTAVVFFHSCVEQIDVAQTSQEFVSCLRRRVSHALYRDQKALCMALEHDWSAKYAVMRKKINSFFL